jgi:hypothetical protein
MFVGLVSDPRWRPPDDWNDKGPERPWDIPWRAVLKAVAWLSLLVGLFVLVPVADHAIGPLAGYLLILITIGIAGWRADRILAGHNWRGMHDYQS